MKPSSLIAVPEAQVFPYPHDDGRGASRGLGRGVDIALARRSQRPTPLRLAFRPL
jgi:hypothetical protein